MKIKLLLNSDVVIFVIMVILILLAIGPGNATGEKEETEKGKVQIGRERAAAYLSLLFRLDSLRNSLFNSDDYDPAQTFVPLKERVLSHSLCEEMVGQFARHQTQLGSGLWRMHSEMLAECDRNGLENGQIGGPNLLRQILDLKNERMLCKLGTMLGTAYFFNSKLLGTGARNRKRKRSWLRTVYRSVVDLWTGQKTSLERQRSDLEELFGAWNAGKASILKKTAVYRIRKRIANFDPDFFIGTAAARLRVEGDDEEDAAK